MISLLIAIIQVHHKGSKNAYPWGVKVLFFLYTEDRNYEPEGHGVKDTEHHFKFFVFI